MIAPSLDAVVAEFVGDIGLDGLGGRGWPREIAWMRYNGAAEGFDAEANRNHTKLRTVLIIGRSG